jgi:acyl carrier protein
MAEVLGRVEHRFGRLDGVIHAAGAVGPEAFAPVTEVDDALVRRHFAPKVDGTLVLDALLRERPPALALLASSLSGVLGGLGFGPYAAANAFLDAFAAGPGRGRWTSVGWEGWRFGSAAEAQGLAALALSPEEGADVFERLAGLPPLAHVLVSTGDLDARVRKWVGLDGLRVEENGRAAGLSARGRLDASPEAPASSRLAAHARPDLGSEYVEPSTAGERVVAAAWQELLGIARVGRHDDFFALGGHSLLAIQLISRLRDVFGVELSVHALFDGPTVAELALQVEAAQATATAAQEARLAELLDLVEGLSEEEVEALLAEEGVEHHG